MKENDEAGGAGDKPDPGEYEEGSMVDGGVTGKDEAGKVGNKPDRAENEENLDPERMPADQKKEGSDWFAIYNPRVSRTLDVDLVHTLEHSSIVCCVRFSADGRYVATGCNRSAQIFDVKTGQKVVHLQDDSVERDGDVYIRSVCFSPDGRYLATGAQDKLIRVSIASLYLSLYFVNMFAGLGYCITHY